MTRRARKEEPEAAPAEPRKAPPKKRKKTAAPDTPVKGGGKPRKRVRPAPPQEIPPGTPTLLPMPDDPEIPPPPRGAHAPRYHRFLVALALGNGPAAAGKLAGYSLTQAHRRWRQPDTQRYLVEIQAAQMESALRDVTALRSIALLRARELLLSPTTPPEVRARLILGVLDRTGFSPKHQLQIDATIRARPYSARTPAELLQDLRDALAEEGLEAEEIEQRVAAAAESLSDAGRG